MITFCVQAAWAVLATLNLSALVIWATLETRTRTTLAAAALTLITALGLCVLSYVEHTRAVRPSSIINTYLAATVLFDVAHTRTLWLRADDYFNYVVAYISAAALVVKSIVLVLEALDKRRLLRPEFEHYPPEATSSIYNRSFFWWLNPLFCRGFSHEIDIDDLFALDKHLQAAYSSRRFQAAWGLGESLSLAYCQRLDTIQYVDT